VSVDLQEIRRTPKFAANTGFVSDEASATAAALRDTATGVVY